MKNFLWIQEKAVQAIAAKAAELKIKGVATAMIWDTKNPAIWTPTILVVENFFRGPKPENGPDDIGANYASVALEKLCQMMRTKKPSGQIAFKGENNYQGGDLIEMNETGLILFASFSGGKALEDLEAARDGLAVMHDLVTQPEALRIEHVSMWVLNNHMGMALSFFEHLGWREEEGRHPTWAGGEARFVRPPTDETYLQLTCDEDAIQGDEGSAFHVAMKTKSVQSTLANMYGFCNGYNTDMFHEDVGGGKVMVFIPALFCGAIELVPE